MDSILFDNISRLCEENHITLDDLQMFMGYDSDYVNFINYLYDAPSFAELIKVAKILKTDTAALLNITDHDNCDIITIEKWMDMFIDKLITDTKYNKIYWSSLTEDMEKDFKDNFPYEFYGKWQWYKGKEKMSNYSFKGYYTTFEKVNFFIVVSWDENTSRPVNSKYYVLARSEHEDQYTPLYVDDNRSSKLYCTVYYNTEISYLTSCDCWFSLNAIYNYVNSIDDD